MAANGFLDELIAEGFSEKLRIEKLKLLGTIRYNINQIFENHSDINTIREEINKEFVSLEADNYRRGYLQ